MNEGDLVDQLPLDSRHVGELGCYTRLCEKRFRIVLEQPGDLAVSLLPELASDDDQVRLVLEGIRGVIARDGTGRGPHPDVPALAVGETVSSGIYFVLIQSVGSSIPFQLTARLTPREDAMPPLADPVEPVEPRVTPIRDDPPPQLVEVPLPGDASAGFDPAVSFESLRTFRFPAPSDGDAQQPGAVFEQPIDRQLRRHLADALVQRGFRQASGNEPADLIVDFSRGSTNRVFRGIPMLYERYGFGAGESWGFGDRVDTRATLVVDLVDTRSDRIAWHARTTRSVGPGITPGQRTDALLQESVIEVLAGFPPR